MKPYKIIFLFFSSIVPLLLTNCSPSQNSILNLKPQTENNEWYKGKEIATVDNDSLNIKISFDRSENNDYVFDIEITNYSETPILVEPERFIYKVKSGKIYEGKAIELRALDPEKVIQDLQKNYAIHKNDIETQAMVSSFGSFLQFVGQTKALITNDSELSERLDHQTKRMQENQLIENIENNRISNYLDNSSYIWEILALRKTTLYPFQSIAGKVFFPISELAETLEFIFPIGGYELKILYNQTNIPLYEKYVDPNLYY